MKKLLLITLFFTLTGCGTLFGESKQAITISSNPSEAKVFIKNNAGNIVHTGITPITVTLSKHDGSYFGGESYTIDYEKEGYKPTSTIITTTENAWAWANILCGYMGIINIFLIEPWNGGNLKLPNNVHEDLTSE